MLSCSVCGSKDFTSTEVLSDGLTAEWQLSPAERAYIDRQQGTACKNCANNFRSIALSDAILAAMSAPGTSRDFVTSPVSAGLKFLEINEAGMLSPVLRQMPGHVLAVYPEVDIHDMPYETSGFDLVVHSDSLEHVARPVRALAECRRVLRPGGWLCFTIPTIVGRLTRSRAGLPKSYHGNPVNSADDYEVQTEFGADMWTYVIEAGFDTVTITTVSFPDATAISARRQL